MLKPKARFDRITDIPIDFLKENDIKAIILDVDNTLIDLSKNTIEELDKWIEAVKDAGMKLCIASNSNKKEKIKKVAQEIDVHYIYFSCKPFKKGLKKAMEYLDVEPEHIAEIGDQVFTDVLGANRMNMFSILTKPIEMETGAFNKFKRKMEQKVL